jgi:Rhs element Vgr protein
MPPVTPTLVSAGTTMPGTYQLLSIDITREVDRIPHAEIRVIDGSASLRTFAVSDSSFFLPGSAMELSLRYEGDTDTPVFSGLVVRHSIEASRAGSVLTVVLKDPAFTLCGLRKSAVFADMDDATIIKKLLDGTEVTAGTFEATAPKHSNMVQFHCTVWDFILARADALGLAVVVEDGTLSLKKKAIAGSAVATFEYGISQLYEFELEVDAGSQYAAIESVSWDPATQALSTAVKATSVTLAPGNLDAATLAGSVGNSACTLNHAVPVVAEEMQAWADAQMARSRLAMLRGRISVPGLATLKLLDVIAIAGMGDRFNGQALITGLRHRFDRQGWRTDVQLGGPPESFVGRTPPHEPPAAGLLPAVSGLQIGVVADFVEDSTGELLIKVLLPSVDMQTKSAVWARLASPDAGPTRGFYFRPEPKDEVVVGFLNSDPRCPVILGSLFSSKNAPPTAMGTPDDKNEKRGLVTKAGTTIGFVDAKKPSVYIATAGGNKLLLDEETGGISLTDQNGNSITMDKNGITLKSAGVVSVEASKDVTITGSKVAIK